MLFAVVKIFCHSFSFPVPIFKAAPLLLAIYVTNAPDVTVLKNFSAYFPKLRNIYETRKLLWGKAMKIFTIKKSALIASACVLCALFAALALARLLAGGGETPAAERGRLLPVYSVQRPEGERLCALTFDAAEGDADIGQLIEILGRYNVKATFFVTGEWAEKYSESVKKLADAGHELANRSYSHPRVNQLSREALEAEIVKCDDALAQILGKRPNLFRAPYGEYNDRALEAARSLGHEAVQWDVDSLDGQNLSASDVTARVLKRVGPGSILLFHSGAQNTPQALGPTLEGILAKGLALVPVSNLIYRDNYEIDETGRQRKKEAAQ
jgi:peptidoglycan/xylan/chitin deacetylase (PgdA/CDA1 family)